MKVKAILVLCACLAFAVPSLARGHGARGSHAAHSVHAAGGTHTVRAHAKRGHYVKAHQARNPRHTVRARHRAHKNAFRPG